MTQPPDTPDQATIRFRACVAEVLTHEGGYVDHPRDPGGCTNFGITRATLQAWRRARVTCADVRAMDVAEARAIYRTHYWNAIRADDLPAGIDLVLFDAAVNSGRRRAAEWLQAAVGVEEDGAIGPVTLRATWATNDRGSLIERICAARMVFLRELPTWSTFGRGWTSRVDRVCAVAMRLAGGQ
ncbi:glycoside hydrolase family 108 protein [Roseomonas eburnea]|uniref:Glycoside hydrolase family 108 protein n=1 Tax=Neoroseomonas eburnea TaxID=1346889 RepID=A0A9X9XDZ8_9PROT|nr:glycoside hydrolase family 108 protein [Neoroseomonas eburnea]MBR0681934.1 glycoside hydrolase family 108 protein [Neoroseomonas eburnea]